MKITGAQITIKALEEAGIKLVTGIPGGSNLPLYDALHKSSIKHILARHEQGAGFISQGMARTSGTPAVTFATSGPGATNLLTAVADANHDSIPLIAITGQVPRSMIGTMAFQEANTCHMFKTICKKTYFVKSARELLGIMPEAFKIASSGRPGPVLIDIPKDVQLEEIDLKEWQEMSYEINCFNLNFDEQKILEIAKAINGARRPVIMAGGGVIHANASAELQTFAEKGNIPLALTLMGLGSFDPQSDLYLGMPGMHGAEHTNYILAEADLLLAFGIRFDDRAIGKAGEFCPQAKIIHIDIDGSELGKIKNTHISLEADIKTALQKLHPLIEKQKRAEWLEKIMKLKQQNKYTFYTGEDELNPLNLIRSIAEFSPEDAIITTDVGQHQMWIAQVYPFKNARTFLTSGGMGTMGFGLPAAIGAALENPDKKIICISGDGSFQMNMQELALLAELNLNIAVIILNNKHLGLVRQQQELFYNKNYIASKFEQDIDFAAIGQVYGIKSCRLEENSARDTLRELIEYEGPSLIDALICEQENVFPMVKPGAANVEMIKGCS
jgi:acetolactate synthase-1/2/3 large subunit